MIRFLFRFIGLWLLAGAFFALVMDGTRSISAGRLAVTQFGAAWDTLHPSSFDAMRNWIEMHLPVWVWNPVLLSVMLSPLFVVLAVLGILFVLVGRKRERKIGYSSRD
ncbi:MAG TPA: hypothetical protein VHD34_09410 [Xanthobacteraceae bacterium]|nr:hypothetical protein [Xanthobacteraceae bacterium]